jgi:hypothetical protein
LAKTASDGDDSDRVPKVTLLPQFTPSVLLMTFNRELPTPIQAT